MRAADELVGMQYLARQPIFDSRGALYGYELLFRASTAENCFGGNDTAVASKKVIDAAVMMGLDSLGEGHALFVNCTEDVLLAGYPSLFPADATVIEVLETVRPTEAVVDACRDFKVSGYRIALDDFVEQPGYEPLIEVADIIKVDFRACDPRVQADMAARHCRQDLVLLAEKIETAQEFEDALRIGYTLFQGYYFSKPTILATPKVASLDAHHFRLMTVLTKRQINYREIESLIKADPAICYRLLRYLNSLSFCFHSEVQSIMHALVLLGEVELRKWLLLVCAISAVDEHKQYLLTGALVRARFLELLGNADTGAELFILGLVSIMDAILNIPMETIARQLALPPRVRDALTGADNALKKKLSLVEAYEKAEWSKCEQACEALHIVPVTLTHAYVEALQWTRKISGA